jgi:hypothetical protein
MQRSNKTGSSLETDLKLRTAHYEQVIRKLRQELADAKAEGLKLSRLI